jgi:hypothetical protein
MSSFTEVHPLREEEAAVKIILLFPSLAEE